MKTASWEQVKTLLDFIDKAIKNGLKGANALTEKAQETADAATKAAKNVEAAVGSKMEATNPVGSGSFSMGRRASSTIGMESHTEGSYNVASGDQSHAEGYGCEASGMRSHAEGWQTDATAAAAHAEGYETKALYQSSHAEGSNNKASGMASHVEGGYSEAWGDYSHAEGRGSFAYGYAQHVQGQYNIADTKGSNGSYKGKHLHIVGNGEDENSRSNAHTLDWDGNAWYAGTVEGTGIIIPSPNGTRYKVTVDDSGNLTATALQEDP